jgi:hypothetical protein
MSTALVCVLIPQCKIDLLRTSKALWDTKDELRYVKTGKLPPTRKMIRVLIDNHIKARNLK